jgi:threonine dehydratase
LADALHSSLLWLSPANCLAVSRRANQVTTLPAITSIAKTLGALAPCQESFNWTQRHAVISCEVEDKDVVQVMSWFLRDHNMLVFSAFLVSTLRSDSHMVT